MPMERINSYRARKQREVDREMAARETRVRGAGWGAALGVSAFWPGTPVLGWGEGWLEACGR